MKVGTSYLSIVDFVFIQDLITELLINVSQRCCGVERDTTSHQSFSFLKVDLLYRENKAKMQIKFRGPDKNRPE